MRVRYIALLGLVALSACSTSNPLIPSASQAQKHYDQTTDSTASGTTAATAGSGLFGSGH